MVDWSYALEAVQLARLPGDPAVTSRLRRARLLIERELAQDLDLDRLAREAAYSRFHFHRSFEQTYGETPAAYLRRQRMERARMLLLETDLTVTEVAFAVGFRSLGSFSDRFKRTWGRSPDAFRRTSVDVVRPRRAVPSCFLSVFGG